MGGIPKSNLSVSHLLFWQPPLTDQAQGVLGHGRRVCRQGALHRGKVLGIFHPQLLPVLPLSGWLSGEWNEL